MSVIDGILMIASAVVIWRAEPAMARMSKSKTCARVRFSVWLQAVSALSIIASILWMPALRDYAVAGFVVGSASLLAFDLRARRRVTEALNSATPPERSPQ